MRLQAEKLAGIDGHQTYFRDFSRIQSSVLFVRFARRHKSKIISISVRVVSGHQQRCCITVSDDGSTESWDILSSLHIATLLESPLPEGTVVSSCFSMDGCQKIILGCSNGSICVYRNSKLVYTVHARLNIRLGLFTCKKEGGVWAGTANKRLEWISFEEELKNVPNSFTSPYENFECSICKSLDHTKATFLSSNCESIVIINCITMREICRFKQTFLTSGSIGQFSNSKDLIAVSRSNDSIMIWKLDTRSRFAQFESQASKLGELTSMAFTTDERNLLCGYQSTGRGSITKVDIKTGQWLQMLASSPDCPVYNLAIFSHFGEEKFLR